MGRREQGEVVDRVALPHRAHFEDEEDVLREVVGQLSVAYEGGNILVFIPSHAIELGNDRGGRPGRPERRAAEHGELVVDSSGARAPQERAEAQAEASATASESNEDVTAMISEIVAARISTQEGVT